jgi:putative oxidoreductase
MTTTMTTAETTATTTTAPEPTDAPAAPEPFHRLRRAQQTLVSWLAAYSIIALRISLGLVITGFGALKFVPGASPAEGLVMQTTEALTFGLVDGTTAVVATAIVETGIGLSLLTGRLLKPGMGLMAGWLVGILMPVVLFPAQMFPGGLPTLAAQYVLKDIILVAAAMVVAAAVLGARFVAPPRTAA